MEDRRVRADLIEVFKMFRGLSYTFLNWTKTNPFVLKAIDYSEVKEKSRSY